MANRLYISKIFPLQFYKLAPDENPKYVSKHMDDWEFSETILPWQQRTCYKQPVHLSDLISLQLQSTYGPINLKLCRTDGSVVDTIPFSQILQNATDPELYIYECDVSMNIYEAGDYYLLMEFGNPVALSLKSELIILSEKIENTLLLEYSHYRFYQQMIFETGYTAAIRIPGILKYGSPKATTTLYDDDDENVELIESVPFDIWQLRIGLSFGIPPYLARKINRILGCSNLQIDGKYYVRGSAELEELDQKDYPMSAWTIDLREQNNSDSRLYDNEVAQEGFVAVMVNADSKGFGADTGGNETVITDIT